MKSRLLAPQKRAGGGHTLKSVSAPRVFQTFSKVLKQTSYRASRLVAAKSPDPPFSGLSWRPRSGTTQHSHFYRGGRGVARPNILASIVVAAEWPDPTFLLLSWWSRSRPTQHSHFHRGGRGVARPSILTSIEAAAEWADQAFSLLSWWPRSGAI